MEEKKWKHVFEKGFIAGLEFFCKKFSEIFCDDKSQAKCFQGI